MLRDDDPLCEWDGPLLPLWDVDYAEMIAHGSDRGYQQHRRWGVAICDACAEAHRLSRRGERERARARRG